MVPALTGSVAPLTETARSGTPTALVSVALLSAGSGSVVPAGGSAVTTYFNALDGAAVPLTVSPTAFPVPTPSGPASVQVTT